MVDAKVAKSDYVRDTQFNLIYCYGELIVNNVVSAIAVF